MNPRILLLTLLTILLTAGCDQREIRSQSDRFPTVGHQVPPGGQERIVEIGPVPDTAEAFAKVRDRLCRTPQGAAAAMVTVLLACNQDQTRGSIFATMLLHPDRLRSGRAYQGREPGQHYRDLLRIARAKPYIARSYLIGAAPDNGYQPAEPFGVRWQPHAQPSPSSDRVRVMLHSSGADTPRPVTLRKGSDGIWKVDEASSLFVGVRPPQAP